MSIWNMSRFDFTRSINRTNGGVDKNLEKS